MAVQDEAPPALPQESIWVEESPSIVPPHEKNEPQKGKVRNRDMVRRTAAILRSHGGRPEEGPLCWVSANGEAALEELAVNIHVSAEKLRETLEHSVAAHCERGKPKFRIREEEGGKCFVALAQRGGEPWVPTSVQPTVPKPRPSMAPKYRTKAANSRTWPIAPPRAPPWTLREAPRLPSPRPPKRRRRLGGDISQGAVRPVFGDPHPVHSLAGLPTTIFSCPNEWRLWRLEEQALYQCYLTGKEALDSIPDE